jgi:type IV pilus assembly protein PilV
MQRSNRQPQHFTSIRRQSGVSLIEVMVAFVVLSVGLLGLALLQAKGMRLNTDAYLRSQATILANEIIESMRMVSQNPNADLEAFYVSSTKPSPCGGCANGKEQATADLINWYDAQAQLLPSPTASITYNSADDVFTITMRWVERGVSVDQSWVVSI